MEGKGMSRWVLTYCSRQVCGLAETMSEKLSVPGIAMTTACQSADQSGIPRFLMMSSLIWRHAGGRAEPDPSGQAWRLKLCY